MKFIVTLLLVLFTAAALAGGGEQQMMAVPDSLKDRAVGLITDEALMLAMLSALGIGAGIAFMGFWRLFDQKPAFAGLGYSDWVHRMRIVASVAGLAWALALNLIFLEASYGWLAKIVVASAPSLIAGFLTPYTYDYVRRRWLRKHGGGGPDGPDDDVTQLTRK